MFVSITPTLPPRQVCGLFRRNRFSMKSSRDGRARQSAPLCVANTCLRCKNHLHDRTGTDDLRHHNEEIRTEENRGRLKNLSRTRGTGASSPRSWARACPLRPPLPPPLCFSAQQVWRRRNWTVELSSESPSSAGTASTGHQKTGKLECPAKPSDWRPLTEVPAASPEEAPSVPVGLGAQLQLPPPSPWLSSVPVGRSSTRALHCGAGMQKRQRRCSPPHEPIRRSRRLRAAPVSRSAMGRPLGFHSTWVPTLKGQLSSKTHGGGGVVVVCGGDGGVCGRVEGGKGGVGVWCVWGLGWVGLGWVGSGRVGSGCVVLCCAVPCRAVPCRAVPCRAVRCGVVWCGVVQCGVVQCGVVLCGVVLCGVLLCGVVWRGVAWRGVAWRGVA